MESDDSPIGLFLAQVFSESDSAPPPDLSAASAYRSLGSTNDEAPEGYGSCSANDEALEDYQSCSANNEALPSTSNKRPRLGELSQTLVELVKQTAPLSLDQLIHARMLCTSQNVNDRVEHTKLGHWTLLHIAIARGHTELAQLLLDNKADATALTGIETSAMHIAADRGNLEAIRLLRVHGADNLPTKTGPWYTDKDKRAVPNSVINEPDHGVELQYEQEVKNGKLLLELDLPMLPLSKAHLEWLFYERELLRSLAGLYSHKYLFDIERIVRVSNPQLQSAYDQHREQTIAGLPPEDGADAKERIVFHGTERKNLLDILRDGLKAGMPSANKGDDGYYGDRRRGVYVTKCADYAMYYTATPEHRPDESVPPPDHMAIIMFKCVLGKVQKMSGMNNARPPDSAYHCNESPKGLEYYLYADANGKCAQCLPTHVLHVRRKKREDTSQLSHGLHEVYS